MPVNGPSFAASSAKRLSSKAIRRSSRRASPDARAPVFLLSPAGDRVMPTLIDKPVSIAAAGDPPKQITEFVGRVATQDTGVSVARMVSPAGWREPGQRPEFQEVTVVLRGCVR